MQLTRDSSAVNFIRAWEPGRIRIAERWVAGNVIVGPDSILEAWTTVEPHVLTIEHLEPALALEPTIIVLGTGTERFLPDVELMAGVPGFFVAHVMSAMVLFALWPFTRLVHVWSAPIGYLVRPAVVYRSRDPRRGSRVGRPGWEPVQAPAARPRRAGPDQHDRTTTDRKDRA